MDERLQAAQSALVAGRREEAIAHLVAAVEADAGRPAQVYRTLALELYGAGRYADGAAYAAQGLEHHPSDPQLWNFRGVFLRKLHQYQQALEALDRAQRLDPRNKAVQVNRGNVLLDMDEPSRAEQVFARLARQEPRDAEVQRQLGRALLRQNKGAAALARLRSAVALRKEHVDAWLDLIGALLEAGDEAQALATAEKALAAVPDNPRLLEARAAVLRRAGRLQEAQDFLARWLAAHPDAAWAHHQLGVLLADRDPGGANLHLRQAAKLEPARLEYRMSLIESLERTRSGDEGANIEEAYQLLRPLLERRAEFSPGDKKIADEVFVRVCSFEEQALLGEFSALGREWARSGRHAALFKQLARVQTRADRLELLEQHRIWGRAAEQAAAKRPVRRPPPRSPGRKLRLGFMSSDLRAHPVGYFALPLFDHLDHERFEVFVYSFYQGPEDAMQQRIARQASAYRWWPEISVREAAQRIADDDLDMLVELGGSTHMNKLEVMAYRPAPRQASWLGYPHSAGLSTIDHLILDPYILPPDRELLLEAPLLLKHAWYPIGPASFRDEPAVEPAPPVQRNGFLTFGTANNPQKYSLQALRTWAAVLRRCPQSRFLFVRPEGGSPSFRRNIRRIYEAEGVAPERIQFEPVRGRHLPHYNRIDITLDAFPQTGGTTTCESLWMGAPCVTLVGPAPFERLSYSVLMNLDLPELCADSVEGFVEAAAQLGSDVARLAELRRTLRARIRASPPGQVRAWAADFYQAIAATVAA